MAKVAMRIEGGQYTNQNNCELEYDPEQIQRYHTANTAVLTIQGSLRQISSLEADLQGRTIELFNLSGNLSYHNLSVPMRPLTDFRYSVLGSENAVSVPLAFELTQSQLHYMEQMRHQSGPKVDMVFTIQLQGRVLVGAAGGDDTCGIRFARIATTANSNSSVRIARSDWLDGILPGLGYNETLLIELPLPQYPTVSAQMIAAVQKLEIARQHLRDELYREAVHQCREAKDALTDRNATALMDSLKPYIGDKKAKTADDILRAFGNLYTASSHPDPSKVPVEDRIEITQDDAELAVNTLTFVLRYVAQAIHTQGIATQ